MVIDSYLRKLSEQHEKHMGAGGHIVNIENRTLDNTNFREVVHTASKSQLVVMSLSPGEDIGEEAHDVDQFIRIEAGDGKGVLGDENFLVEDGTAIVVPAGVKHNIINTSDGRDMKLYAIYSPPQHPEKTIHHTKDDAKASEEG